MEKYSKSDEELVEEGKKMVIASKKSEKKKGGFIGGFLGGFLGGGKKEKDEDNALPEGYGTDEEVVTEVTTDKESAPSEQEKDITLRELNVMLERVNGKLEAEREMRSSLETRIAEISERVGEIRASVLERDTSFRNIESEFSEFKNLIELVQPSQIRKELNEHEVDVLSTKAKVETLGEQLSTINEQVGKIKDTIENIKSFENLATILEELEKKIKIIEATKRDVDKGAGKVEAVFMELSSRIIEFEKRKGQIDSMNEIQKDMLQELDKMKVKVEGYASKSYIHDQLKNYITKDDTKRLKEYISAGDVEQIKKGLSEFLDFKVRIEKDISSIRSDVSNARKKFENRSEEIEADVAGLRKESIRADKEIENRILSLSDYGEKIEELNVKVSSVNTHVKTLNDRIAELEADMYGFRNHVLKENREIKNLLAEIAQQEIKFSPDLLRKIKKVIGM